MALYSRLGSDEAHDKPLPSLPSPTLTNPDLVLPHEGFPRLVSLSPRTIRQAHDVSYMRDKTNEQPHVPTTPTRDAQKERRGLMSRKMLLIRSQTASQTGVSFGATHDDAHTPMASSPLLHDRLYVEPSGMERRGSTSSLDSEEMAKMPDFLQKYRNVDMTDDETTDAEGTVNDSRSYVEQRRAKEEEEQVSALLSKRAEEILANAKKRLNLMEGNLRGARDLVAPLTAANLKRATSLSHSYGSSPVNYAHHRLESITYDTDPYNPSRRMLHSQASSPTMRHDYHTHTRGESDLEPERSHTSLSRTRFPIRPSGSAGLSPDLGWAGALRATRSYDSLGISKLIIPDSGGKPSRLKNSPDSNLEPVSEDGAQKHIETSYRNSFRAPEVVPVIGLGVAHLAPPSVADSHSSTSEDLRDQMESLKGKISTLRERAREDSMRRASQNNLRGSSPFNNAAHESPDLWYNQSSSQGSLPSAKEHSSPGTSPWLSAPTGSRNAFAEQAARQQSSPVNSQHKHITHNTRDHHQHHHPKGSVDMPGAFIDDDDDHDDDDSEQYGSEELERDSVYDDNFEHDAPAQYQHDMNAENEEEGSVYEDAESDAESLDDGCIAHEDREDAFDYEHFFLHSAMGSYNSGRVTPDTDTSSISSAGTARGPQPTADFDNVHDNKDEDVEEQTPHMPSTPDALRQIESRLQQQHGRSISSESLDTIKTFATADEDFSYSRSGSRLDWTTSNTTEQRRPGTAVRDTVVTPTPSASTHEMDDSSDRADSGVGGLSHAAGKTTPKSPGHASSAVPSTSTHRAATVHMDPTAVAVKALMDPAGKLLGLRDKAVLHGLIESLRRVCVKLQEEDENQYESHVLRRRLDDARRVLDGLGPAYRDV